MAGGAEGPGVAGAVLLLEWGNFQALLPVGPGAADALQPLLAGPGLEPVDALLVADGEADIYFAFNPGDASSAIAQGLLMGFLGCSATFVPLVADTSLWFTRRRGIAVAICASGNYLAGAVWPPVMQHFFEAIGWRNAYMAAFYDIGDAYIDGHSQGGVAHAFGVGLRLDVTWLGLIERTMLRFDVAKTVNSNAPWQFWFGVSHPF